MILYQVKINDTDVARPVYSIKAVHGWAPHKPALLFGTLGQASSALDAEIALALACGLEATVDN